MSDAHLREILDLVLRWVHLIAGIMWIGNSMLFNWLDRNLAPKADSGQGTVGEIWMVHSGGYYQMEKMLAPRQMPPVLHWFKWQAYTTWITGFSLLVVVYYLGGASYLIDPAVADLTPAQGTALGLGLLAGGFVAYDVIWRSLQSRPAMASILCLGLLAGAVYGATQVFSGRGAYLHVGALLGTLMAGNVFFHIMPAQRHMIAATSTGQVPDGAFSLRAKTRSIHNNYMTFPVLFIMVSSHFPSTFGHTFNGLILAILAVGGATVRHLLNIRFVWRPWLPVLLTVAAITLGAVTVLTAPKETPSASAGAGATGSLHSFRQAQAVIALRCQSCHSSQPTDDLFKVAPVGVVLDTPEQMRAHAARIKFRAVESKTMPMANRSGMTEEERAILGRWVDQGARLE